MPGDAEADLVGRALGVAVLAAVAGWQIKREYRPPVLKAGVRLYAYIANAGDGSVTVVDLVALKAIATIPMLCCGPDTPPLDEAESESLAARFRARRAGTRVGGVENAG